MSQRRFSTQGDGPAGPRQSGCVWTSWRIRRCPSEYCVLKNSRRSKSSRSRDENPGIRSQSTQSLSPGVNTAGASSALKKASESK